MFFFVFLGKAKDRHWDPYPIGSQSSSQIFTILPPVRFDKLNTSPYEKAAKLNTMISGIILFVKERLSAKDHFQLETAEPQKPSLKLKSYHNPSFQITSQFI